ncbi:MAG TPA: phospholipase D-like domain-containing protein [Anaerolineales bacterium]|nr:phospholipase D-like domain-containing protein [Anaerolineales bacterium]
MSTKRRTSQGITGLGLLVVVIYVLFQIFSGQSSNAPATATSVPPTQVIVTESPTVLPSSGSLSNGASTDNGQTPAWLKVYFTNPNPPDQIGTGIDQFVVPVINNAQKTIDVTSFDLNLPSFVDALVAAAQRGVQVRVVYDGTNGTQKLSASDSPTGQALDAIQTLKEVGIQLVNGGRSNGLMHDKIIIVDDATLFMGSWNMSYNDTYRNNNNLLEITDPTLIANYQAKFNELFVDKRFGTKAQVGAQTPQMTIGGIQVFNYFSPVDHVMDKLVTLVNGAQKSVRFMIFTFTDQDLANAMISRYQAGVDVAGVIENRGASQGALVPLACAKVPVKVDGNKYTMHHKVIVIDDSIVVTGSFNFTKSADTANDDNVIIIYDPAVAKQYLDEYSRVDALAKAPNSADLKCP